MINIERETINIFKVVISNDEISDRKLSILIILKINIKYSKILFYNVVDVLDLIVCLEIKNDK